MLMHLYAFGSVCRGEIDAMSDCDLLALVENPDERFDVSQFSVYKYDRMKALWSIGNPFAWHLWHEARVLFASDGVDVIREWGSPAAYAFCRNDCLRFSRLFEMASAELAKSTSSYVFELSNVFLAMRNLATCFALGVLGIAEFSRHAARRIGDHSVNCGDVEYAIMERCRILATRGKGRAVEAAEVAQVVSSLPVIRCWVNSILAKAGAK